MELETFFEQFELLADAPNGVQKLRELILQLAMRGKLTSDWRTQNSNVETASYLIKRIEIIRFQHLQGNTSKSRSQPHKGSSSTNSNEEIYQFFDIPKSWTWCKVEQIATVCLGGTPSRENPSYWGNDVPWVSSGEVANCRINGTNEYITFTGLANSSAKVYPKGTVLIAMIGQGKTRGQAAILDIDACTNQNVAALVFDAGNINSDYVWYWALSEYERTRSGSQGGAQPALNGRKVRSLWLPLPPFEEQKHIVSKVEQLMALCDELEARQEKRHKRILQLGEVATSQLLTPSTPEAFNQHWQGICDNFDLLYSTPENVSQLRQAILQLAVMGKLVPQDPNDEPASVLLEKIREEKTRLIKEGQIRKSEKLPPVEVEEMPFELPLGWECVRFGELADLVSGVTKGRKLAGRKTASYPYLRVANVQRGYLELKVIKEIEIPVNELDKYRLQPGDVLLTEGGDWDKLGRTAIWKGEIEDCIHQNHVFRARPLNEGLRSHWIALYTNSRMGRSYFEEASKKTTNLASINMTQLRNCPIPVPPVLEQDRIISKVNHYFLLCNELEAKLTQSINDREKLMEAGVRQVLAA